MRRRVVLSALSLFLVGNVAEASSIKPITINGEPYYLNTSVYQSDRHMKRLGKMHIPCADGGESCLIDADYYANCDEGVAFPVIVRVISRAGQVVYTPANPYGKGMISQLIQQDEIEKIYRHFC